MDAVGWVGGEEERPGKDAQQPNIIPSRLGGRRGGGGGGERRGGCGARVREAYLAMGAPSGWCEPRTCRFLPLVPPSCPAPAATPPTSCAGGGSRPCGRRLGGGSAAWHAEGRSVSTPGRRWRALGIPTGGRSSAENWWSRPLCGRQRGGWGWLLPRLFAGGTGPCRLWPIIGNGWVATSWAARARTCRRRRASGMWTTEIRTSPQLRRRPSPTLMVGLMVRQSGGSG